MIGMRQPCSRVFEGIPWGTDKVARLTRERFSELEFSWQEMPELRDIDRPEDLELLQ